MVASYNKKGHENSKIHTDIIACIQPSVRNSKIMAVALRFLCVCMCVCEMICVEMTLRENSINSENVLKAWRERKSDGNLFVFSRQYISLCSIALCVKKWNFFLHHIRLWWNCCANVESGHKIISFIYLITSISELENLL